MKTATIILSLMVYASSAIFAQGQSLQVGEANYKIYPDVLDKKPNIDSPLLLKDGREFVLAVTKDEKYAIIPVELKEDNGICNPLVVDIEDFPTLATTGLHNREQLLKTKTITGRSVDEITMLGQPGELSTGGFMADDEDIISVIFGDDLLVEEMGFTHPDISKPLFHVLNMMSFDLSINRWNMARHQWENIVYFHYHGKIVNVEAYDTKGGQLSIFDDRLKGGFHIKIWHELNNAEEAFLQKHYGHLNKEDYDAFKQQLTFLNIGEMQPQYIKRYGFYEGHTFWRADPVAIAFIFGMLNLNELYQVFEGKLDEKVLNHHLAISP